MRKLLSIVVVAAAGLLVGCASESAVTIRVLSYNIHHGEGMDGRVDLERIARVICESGADLVALQEVDRGVARTDRVDQPARLAELTGMQAVFERNIDYQGGEYGNAVLSRFPVTWHTNHALPQSLPDEQRGLLEVHVRIAGARLIFFATHFDYRPDDGERIASVAMLRELVSQKRGVSMIVAGDLNALPESRVIADVSAFLTDTYRGAAGSGMTYPADKPDKRIDYVLYDSGDALRSVDCRVIAEDTASDHRPLLAVFEFDAPRNSWCE